MIAQPPSATPAIEKYRALAMAKNLGQVAVQTTVLMVTGQKWKRTPEEQAACLAVCQGIEGKTDPCPEWNAGLGLCGKCGCVGRFKAFLEAAQCPLKKWPAASDKAGL
jgi:hypothetical protein